jgi:diadenosine tetraphosphatase ApaH/serine/threonine PP2A family protein phosphatase
MLATIVALGIVGVPGAAGRIRAEPSFSLRGSNGFRVSVSGSASGLGTVWFAPRLAEKVLPSKLPPGNVVVGVSKGPSVSLYVVPGAVTAHRVRARLGHLGRISVFFHKRATKVVKLPPQCTGPRRVSRRGRFAGTIRFHGEHGYTSVDANRARGRVELRRKTRCHFGGDGGGGGGNHRQVKLTAGDRSTDVVAIDDPRGPGPTLIAATSEVENRVSVFRVLFDFFAPASSFTYDAALTTAQLDPPAPFSGTADFAAPRTWTGTLAVSFPGDPDVPLAGPGFKARLKRG